MRRVPVRNAVRERRRRSEEILMCRLEALLREHMGRPSRSDPNPVRRPALRANEWP